MSGVEAWSGKDEEIEVTGGNGFLFNLKLRGKLNSSPEVVYDILTDPNSIEKGVWRNVKVRHACTLPPACVIADHVITHRNALSERS